MLILVSEKQTEQNAEATVVVNINIDYTHTLNMFIPGL